MKLKLTFAAVLAATFALATGCGGSGDDTSSADTQQDTEDITALIANINTATKEKDALAYCGLMQPSGVTEVFNTSSQCVRETTKILEQDSSKQPELKVEDVQLDGDRATVTLVNNAGGAPIELVKEGGKWYVPLGGTAYTELSDE